MSNDARTWELIHSERAGLADQFEALTPDQWAADSLCAGWSVHVAAAHILAGAEQAPAAFLVRFAASAFRFDTMIGRDARRLSVLSPEQIVQRLRARTTTTNRPPAPVTAMLGEAVVHGADIRRPLGLPDTAGPEAALACLRMYESASFPVGGRKRIAGLRLTATDVDWSHGDGATVTGPAMSLVLAMTGRRIGLEDLSGDGVPTLRARVAAA